MRKIINHIWKYFTNPDYRLKVYLKRLNKKKADRYRIMQLDFESSEEIRKLNQNKDENL